MLHPGRIETLTRRLARVPRRRCCCCARRWHFTSSITSSNGSILIHQPTVGHRTSQPAILLSSSIVSFGMQKHAKFQTVTEGILLGCIIHRSPCGWWCHRMRRDGNKGMRATRGRIRLYCFRPCHETIIERSTSRVNDSAVGQCLRRSRPCGRFGSGCFQSSNISGITCSSVNVAVIVRIISISIPVSNGQVVSQGNGGSKDSRKNVKGIRKRHPPSRSIQQLQWSTK